MLQDSSGASLPLRFLELLKPRECLLGFVHAPESPIYFAELVILGGIIWRKADGGLDVLQRTLEILFLDENLAQGLMRVCVIRLRPKNFAQQLYGLVCLLPKVQNKSEEIASLEIVRVQS